MCIMYSLSTCCLNKAQLRRLDGFQAKCLRTILGIAPSFYSRISNNEVLRRAAQNSASQTLLQQQLNQFGKVLRSRDTSHLFSSSLVTGTKWSLIPTVSFYIRRVGRPRKEWVPTILKEALTRSGARVDQLRALALNPTRWKETMTKH